MRIFIPLTAALLIGGGLAAQADTPAGITAHHGRIIETEKAGSDTQGFIEIDNHQAAADTLTGVNCAIADRTSLVGPGGDAIKNLLVPAGKNLILTAKGPHLWLRSTHFSVDQGGAIPCNLIFQNAGEISVYLYPVAAPK